MAKESGSGRLSIISNNMKSTGSADSSQRYSSINSLLSSKSTSSRNYSRGHQRNSGDEPGNSFENLSSSKSEEASTNEQSINNMSSIDIKERLLRVPEVYPRTSPNIGLLQGTEHLFFKKFQKKKATISANVEDPTQKSPAEKYKCQRIIVNSSARTIYYCRLSTCKSEKWFMNKFIYHVVDYHGRTVVITNGEQSIFGCTANATISMADNAILGSIEQEFCDTAYTIKDKDGHIQFRIRGPCFGPCVPCVLWCFEEKFEITLANWTSEMGLIGRKWKKHNSEFNGIFGLSLPLKMEIHSKALLMGAAFLIHFQYYRYGGNGRWIFLLMLIVLATAVYPVGWWLKYFN